MAIEYEIKDVGFIGSLWGGESNQPKKIGRTFELRIINQTPSQLIPTVGSLSVSQPIINGATLPLGPQINPVGSRTHLFFTDSSNLNVSELNKNLSNSQFYFQEDILQSNIADDFFGQMKINPAFLKQSRVLFRYSKVHPRQITFSRIPLQENWQFDSSDKKNVVYFDQINQDAIFAEFVILLSESQILKMSSAFQNSRIVIDEDPFLQNKRILINSIGEPVMPANILDLEKLIRLGGSYFDEVPDPANEETSIFDNNFGIDTTSNKEPEILTYPPKVEIVDVFTPPTINTEEHARKRAFDLFSLNKQFFTISNIDQFNAQLSDVNRKIKLAQDRIIRNIPTSGTKFFDKTQKFDAIVEILFNEFGRNYLYEQICLIEDVDIPEKEPTRWSINEDGIISILPRTNELSIPLVNAAIDDRKNLDEFDSYIDELIDDLTFDDNNVYVFKKVSKVADYSLPIVKYKTKGLFKCSGEKISTFYTGSISQKNKKYFTSVFNEKEGTDNSYHQFDISYCHISGSGSSHIQGEVDLYPAKTMYRKYMLECFGNTNGKFPFKNGVNGDYFYTIQLDRDAYKEKLDSGNFELSLVPLSSSTNQLINTGSNFYPHPTSPVIYTLIDESRDTKQEIVTNEGIQEFYYITSGSLRDGIYNESNDNAWGVVFPKMGLIILDGVVLDQSCSFNTVTASIDGDNSMKLFTSISGAASPTGVRTQTGSFFARSFETFLTETYFCRADFNEFNTSTNYTYTTGSDGFLKYDYFAKEPQSFITTVGLYNKQKELLAVGKLRNPIRKNDGKVCIFEVVVRLN